MKEENKILYVIGITVILAICFTLLFTIMPPTKFNQDVQDNRIDLRQAIPKQVIEYVPDDRIEIRQAVKPLEVEQYQFNKCGLGETYYEGIGCAREQKNLKRSSGNDNIKIVINKKGERCRWERNRESLVLTFRGCSK